jgi:ribonuclease BN (tRNA processing enzyme)
MSDTRIVIYGSSAGFPTKERTPTCLGLWRKRDLYLLDCGEGTAVHFARHEISPEALRAVFVSHTHADHIGGLPMLLQWLQLNQRKGPLTLCLPAEAISAFRDYLDLLYLYPDLLGFDLEYRPVAPGKVYDRDGLLVEAHSNRHLAHHGERLRREGKGRSGQSFSFFLTLAEKGLLFSGDILQPSEIVELANRADLAIVELAHFSPEELGEALATTSLSRLVVTHLIHTLERGEAKLPARIRKAGFKGEVKVARDGEEVEL